jgi:hypothetical protein
MTLQTMPVDTRRLEFRYHGCSEYREYDRDTEKRSEHQARDEDTGYPVFSVRCQVVYRGQRQSGQIVVRVPLATPPADDTAFEQLVTFTDVDARTWSMDGRDGQTWSASAMTIGQPGNGQAPAPAPAKPKTAPKAA